MADYDQVKTLVGMKREAKLKLLSLDGTMPLLALESAHTSNPRYINFYLFKDRRFIKEESVTKILPSFQDEGSEIDIGKSKRIIYRYRGNLPEEKFNQVMEFLDQNVKESREKKVTDSGISISYFKEGKEIVIKSDAELFEKIAKLVPYDIGN